MSRVGECTFGSRQEWEGRNSDSNWSSVLVLKRNRTFVLTNNKSASSYDGGGFGGSSDVTTVYSGTWKEVPTEQSLSFHITKKHETGVFAPCSDQDYDRTTDMDLEVLAVLQFEDEELVITIPNTNMSAAKGPVSSWLKQDNPSIPWPNTTCVQSLPPKDEQNTTCRIA